MSKNKDIQHSILIASHSDRFCLTVKKSLTGFVTIDIRKSASLARRCVLERYYDLVVVDSPLPDESGVEFAMDVTERFNSSVLLVTPRDIFEGVLSRVTDNGILVLPKPTQSGMTDKAVRYLVAVQNRMRMLLKQKQDVEEKMEELRLVNKVKFMLVESKGMSEDDAHRYIGKLAMDNGVSRGKAARMILDDH